MPKSKTKGITCLSRPVAEHLVGALDAKKDQETISRIRELPTCPAGEVVGFGGSRSGRRTSPYQEFIGECLRAKKIKSFGDAPSAMKGCAAEWRKRTGREPR